MTSLLLPSPRSQTATRLAGALLFATIATLTEGCCCGLGGDSGPAGGSPISLDDQLLSAARSGDARRVHELLDAGASPHASSWSTHGSRLGSVLHVIEAAVDSGKWEAVEPLAVDEELKQRALSRALTLGHLGIAEQLAKRGAKPDLSKAFKFYASALEIRDAKGKTALMIAAFSGMYDVVQLLLEQGANPRLLDNQGRSAATHATLGGHHDIASFLHSLSQGDPK